MSAMDWDKNVAAKPEPKWSKKDRRAFVVYKGRMFLAENAKQQHNDTFEAHSISPEEVREYAQGGGELLQGVYNINTEEWYEKGKVSWTWASHAKKGDLFSNKEVPGASPTWNANFNVAKGRATKQGKVGVHHACATLNGMPNDHFGAKEAKDTMQAVSNVAQHGETARDQATAQGYTGVGHGAATVGNAAGNWHKDARDKASREGKKGFAHAGATIRNMLPW
jgi:hypothetical protein